MKKIVMFCALEDSLLKATHVTEAEAGAWLERVQAELGHELQDVVVTMTTRTVPSTPFVLFAHTLTLIYSDRQPITSFPVRQGSVVLPLRAEDQ